LALATLFSRAGNSNKATEAETGEVVSAAQLENPMHQKSAGHAEIRYRSVTAIADRAKYKPLRIYRNRESSIVESTVAEEALG
jgi:hypothetical protein